MANSMMVYVGRSDFQVRWSPCNPKELMGRAYHAGLKPSLGFDLKRC